jgi:ABC-type ATPase with predicted acetyltransferase domain
VLDTMYRGAGSAYRMQNLMMRMTGCRYVEFQSSMSKFNPFAAKAGMRFTAPRRSANYEKGLAWFRRWFEAMPSDYVGVMLELEAMNPVVKTKCVAEMRKFYYNCSSMEKSGDNRANGTKRVDTMTVSYLLKSLQQLVLASPLYGVFENPDYKLPELPCRLPLVAFDNQALAESLNVPQALKQLAQISLKKAEPINLTRKSEPPCA